MNLISILAVAQVPGATRELELIFVWRQATPEAKIIIFILFVFSVIAWSTMIQKALQMRRAKKLNAMFGGEYTTQGSVLDMFDRRIQAEGCPLFALYQSGSLELDARLKLQGGGRRKFISLKGMEHVKRTLENSVAQESLKLESGLILLAIAVSGGPFLGLLGTVWGVMSTFGHIAQLGSASLQTMAPGVAAALLTTIAGLLLAIPSMFAYNWLVHNLRTMTVELDNYAQELISRMETEFLHDEELDVLQSATLQPAPQPVQPVQQPVAQAPCQLPPVPPAVHVNPAGGTPPQNLPQSGEVFI